MSASIKDDGTDAGFQRAAGEDLAKLLRRCNVRPRHLAPNVLLHCRNAGERHAPFIVDDLSTHMVNRLEHAQSWARGGSVNALSNPTMPLDSLRAAIEPSHCLSHSLARCTAELTGLLDDLLAAISNALAIVDIRLAEGANLRRHLPYLLLVGSADDDLVRIRELSLDLFW